MQNQNMIKVSVFDYKNQPIADADVKIASKNGALEPTFDKYSWAYISTEFKEDRYIINVSSKGIVYTKCVKLMVAAGLLLSLTYLMLGCGASKVIKAIGQEGYRFSVLTWSTEGIKEKYDNPSRIVPRKERYNRVAQWMKDSSTNPDIIAIQEVVLAKKYNINLFNDPTAEEWDMPWEIITSIKDITGVTYRVAYFVVEPTGQGANPILWNGLMLLYNPARIRNISISEPLTDWDNTNRTMGYLRNSPPRHESIPAYTQLSLLVDGPAWMGSFRRTNNKWDLGPAYARFSLVNTPDAQFSTYQFHFVPGDKNSSGALSDFVNLTEQKFGSNNTFPPVMLGDFNIGYTDMIMETTNNPAGAFNGFEMIGYSYNDLMGVLAGGKLPKLGAYHKAGSHQNFLLL